jgi:manganese/zinc/iron transport system substrate-binding protein
MQTASCYIKRIQTPILFFALVTALLILAGCKNSPSSNGNAPTGPNSGYTVVATTGMVADIVRNVAGDKAQVKGIIGEGVDPHLYKPTRADVASLSDADIVFYSGLLLEGKMTDVFVKISSKKPVVAVTESIDESYLLEPPEFAGHYDPHLWMDVQGWMKAVGVVNTALAEFDPPNKEFYDQNAQDYLSRLEALDAYCKESAATIPEGSRILVTAHDAFNYMGRAYGIEVLGIQGISTESEAGLGDLNKLVDTLVKRQIKAVFVETSVADKNVKALIEGAKAKGFEIRIGGELFSDAMGAPGSYEGTYIGMIDHNITTIVRALGGQVPEKGLNGKLQ